MTQGRSLRTEADTPLLRKDIGPGDETRTGYGSNGHREETKHQFPQASWTWAKPYKTSQRLPQTIAHRGYKAKYPENTMRSFRGAVEVGTHAIETDIHLTKDGVVVLSHDPDLKRCFGQKEKIIDCDWDYLSNLRTIQEPHEPMPRLVDLLEYVAQPGLEHVWLLFDIKIDNDGDDVMRLIAHTLASVNPGGRPWEERVLMGIWVPKYLSLCTKYVPDFPVAHIGFSTAMAREYLKVPNVGFNMLLYSLLGPVGSRFMRDVRKQKRQLFVWTVNESNLMTWCIQRNVDGVVTDNPELFKQICDDWDEETKKKARPTIMQWLRTIWVWILITLFSGAFRRKFPETVETYIQEHDLRAKATLTIDQL
ncbi:uncharacterized protein PV06_07103 [Exophiala oligosperma]|uniref:GP-PDE domain-containing protein n=1 Tax=Exophiala oligosperma TaxID=215243 RepID=A0A0D2DGQ2_9EURO|nr:uncharacterized protein PV06_07103 [Exophiala oligosperma]KIW41555.1 hypothetical protein PV06_07103 [Exophiala oligosperma]